MRTKIIATIGPRSESADMLEKLVESGMHIARMNFSHCTYDEYVTRTKHIRAASKKLGVEVELLQDVQGPRIRVGELPQQGIELREGDVVVFTTKKESKEDDVFIDSPHLHLDIKKGHPLYLSSGDMEVVTRAIKGNRIFTEVVRGGILYSRKGVNVPDTKLRTSGTTGKDRRDIKFAVSKGVDYVAVSFVQSAHDIKQVRKIVGTKAKIIAKIETALSLRNIDSIIQESDGIMIARGDLGIEVPVERLPFIQKNLIRHAIWHNKPAITATQMLTSMVNHPHPTRAEVSDLANAVFDGTDAVMLSDETASGEYPVQAVKTAVKVVRQAEEYLSRANRL